ncbi:MAG: hypothetical protein QY325_09660 [Flavobacteriales bacterium]|nr:MAG: hypothetical protein QY325_09660 [Flavobacteriales bacterium]
MGDWAGDLSSRRHWSDNPGVAFKDRLRFIFTSAYMGMPSGAGSQEGLEAMRIFPAWSDQAFVGIGAFHAALRVHRYDGREENRA